MAAAVAKLMSNKDLVVGAAPAPDRHALRNTMGERGVLGCRIQPNHPTDDVDGILVSTLDGLLFGCGDAVIGVNPATESVESVAAIVHVLQEVVERLGVPTQTCCSPTSPRSSRRCEPARRSICCSSRSPARRRANASFGITLDAARRGPRGGPGAPRHASRRVHRRRT